MEKKKNITKVLISVSILVVLLIVFYFTTGFISKVTGLSISQDKDTFEECLKQKDITLFINSENSAESLKEIELFSYLKHIEIMNCLRNKDICLSKGVDFFPSWIINGKLIKNDISISELSESSGCEL